MTFSVFFPNFLKTNPDRDMLIPKFKAMLDGNVSLCLDAEAENPDYDMLINGRANEDQLSASSRLKVLVIPWAGLPAGTADMLKPFPHISVHNLHHNAISTAETALSLLFSAAKQTHVYDAQLRADDWRGRYRENPAILLYGKSMLVVGYGSIGKHVAKVGLAMGMDVKGIRRSAGTDEMGVEFFTRDALPALLPETNILMVTAPLTEQTKGMIGEKELNSLKPPAILVNVGRGAVVDQPALYDALKSGKLATAGIDVWYNYPPDEEARSNTPPSDYPFNNFPNVVFSPHRGGGSTEIEEMRFEHLAALINAAARGEQIPNKVDLQAGY